MAARICQSVLLILIVVMPLQADDWPQWLGPQRDGEWREKGILKQLPEGGPKVLWRAKISSGYTGPAVVGDRVIVADYVTQGDQSPGPQKRNDLDGVERVLCLSAKDGSEIWKHEYPCKYAISYPAGPRVTPTVDGDRLYALGAMGNLKCLKLDSGDEVWAKDFQKDYGAKVPIWGFCGHPLVDGDRVYVVPGGDGCVAVALDKRTGKEIWRSLTAREPGYAPPTMIEAAGIKQLLIWHAESLNALDPNTGKKLWSEAMEPNYAMSIIAPLQSGSRLFVGAITKKGMMMELADDKPAAKVSWYCDGNTGLSPVHSAPMIDGDYMYGVDHYGELRCVKLATGERVWSTYDATTGSRRLSCATGFIVRHEDRYFIFNEKGELIIAKLSPEGYQEISRAKILSPTSDAFGRKVVWSHPAFANRCMYVRNDEEIVCVSLAE